MSDAGNDDSKPPDRPPLATSAERSAPAPRRHTVESLKALGFKILPKASGGGFILPTDRPARMRPPGQKLPEKP